MVGMMPIDFPGSTTTLIQEETAEGLTIGLPIIQRDDVNVSCWRAGLLDRLRFLLRGKVYLHVVGKHPAVALMVDS